MEPTQTESSRWKCEGVLALQRQVPVPEQFDGKTLESLVAPPEPVTLRVRERTLGPDSAMFSLNWAYIVTVWKVSHFNSGESILQTSCSLFNGWISMLLFWMIRYINLHGSTNSRVPFTVTMTVESSLSMTSLCDSPNTQLHSLCEHT
jgi:hypothetical protein